MRGQMTGIPFGVVTYDEEPHRKGHHKRESKKAKWYKKLFGR
jgi:hypothetical protein